MNGEFRLGLTQARLKELLHYDLETGIFRWQVSRRGRYARAGTVAGHLREQDGYVTVCLDGVHYLAHRLVWLYVKGKWPDLFLDHRDTNKENNRFKNLRQATKPENSANRPKNRNNRVGHKGVFRHSQCSSFIAQICVNGKRIHLGSFGTAEAASDAYQNAAKALHGEFARGR